LHPKTPNVDHFKRFLGNTVVLLNTMKISCNKPDMIIDIVNEAGTMAGHLLRKELARLQIRFSYSKIYLNGN
jgi:excinuclease UvrABC ATPase subunit